LPYIIIDDIKMHYATAGEGSTLTLLHGAALTLETNWANQIPVFSRKYRVVAIDLRGHGRTNNPKGILNLLMVGDVHKFLEKMSIEGTHLLGFSMGGMIALRLTLEKPELVKTLILCSIGYRLSKEGHDLFVENANPQAMEESNPELAEFYRRIHRSGGPNLWKRLLKQLTESKKEYNLSLDDLSRISVPTLIVVGDRDPYGFTKQALEMHDAIRESELAVFPNADHMIPERRVKLFNETVLDFLERRGAS